MATAQPFQRPRSLTGIGISLAVHALLIGAWQLARPLKLQDEGEARRMQFLRLLPAPETERPQSPLPAPVLATASSRTKPQAARAQPMQAAPETIGAPLRQATEATEATEAAAASSADLLGKARAAAGAIDRALRAENPGRGIKAPVETAQMKLARGIEHAAEMAPNRWYQAPKTQEILDPGGYGRRRYRVITANGTYCLTYESNHGPDGRDTMRDGIPPKMTNCPPHEEPAKAQKWE